MNLFDLLPPPDAPVMNWTPPAPPSLDGVSEVFLNFETTGLAWWANDRPISLSLRTPDGRKWYLPWGHAGGNLDEATVKRWAQRELRGKLITNINTRFECHMARVWGIDLEAQGNTVSDVGHYAALLDDHRKRFSLDELATDYLGRVEVPRLDESRMVTYHAGLAAPRSMYNVELVAQLKAKMWPELDAQNLQRVRALEDRVIFAVVEMEKNGTKIDVELLDRWERTSREQVNRLLMDIAVEAGFKVNPDSPKDLKRVFESLKLPMAHNENGGLSFTDAVLKRIPHPLIQKIRRVGKLIDLRTKYLVKYQKCVGSDGILRYALHQLRTTKDNASDAGEAGTVTGRFSSAALARDVGLNIQQIMKTSKQRVQWGYEEDDDSHDDEIFVIRQLHVPHFGEWLSADAEQIEYRLFAHYANNPKVNEAYKKDPWLSFHRETHAMFKPFRPEQTYKEQKDLNFAQIYGAATIKLAAMLGYITAEEAVELKRNKAYNSPKLAKAKEVQKVYRQVLPEVEPLLKMAAHLARPSCTDWCKTGDDLHRRFQHRGYVESIMGRRQRFPDGQRTHKALNSVIQPGAADINKLKLCELHEARHETGFMMCFTVHDEVDGCTPGPETTEKVREILNRQSIDLRIPILWGVGTGKNWKEAA